MWKIDDMDKLLMRIWKHINQEFIAKQFYFDNIVSDLARKRGWNLVYLYSHFTSFKRIICTLLLYLKRLQLNFCVSCGRCRGYVHYEREVCPYQASDLANFVTFPFIMIHRMAMNWWDINPSHPNKHEKWVGYSVCQLNAIQPET